MCNNNTLDLPESQPESSEGGVNLDGSHLIISWSCLITLLGICKHQGCGDQVLADNMDISRNGNFAQPCSLAQLSPSFFIYLNLKQMQEKPWESFGLAS